MEIDTESTAFMPSCVIHSDLCPDSLYENLIFPRDLSSWTSLKDAAQSRNFEPLLHIISEHTDVESVPPAVYYHRKCRQLFTLRIPTTSLSPAGDAPAPLCNPRRVTTGTTTRVLDEVCIFCRKTQYMRKSNTREQLVQCRDMRADERIREYALSTQNEHLLGIVGCHELVAAEAKYHQSCYRQCIRGTQEKSPIPVEVADPVSEAYRFVVSYIEQEVFAQASDVVNRCYQNIRWQADGIWSSSSDRQH